MRVRMTRGTTAVLVTAFLGTTSAHAGGQFAAPYYIAPTGGSPESVDVGDLDGDGLPDVAMVNFNYGSSNVDIFFQDPATHALNAPIGYTTLWGGRCVEIADIDGDGDNDLVIGSYSSNPIYLLYQTSPGVFSAPTPVNLGSGVNPHIVTSGDFNNDGRTDVAAVEWSGDSETFVLYQQANGTLGAPVPYFTAQEGWNKVFVSDLSADGLDDLVVMNGQLYAAPNVTILYQNAAGSFDPPFSIDRGNVNASAAAAGDLNADGLYDLAYVISSSPSTLYIHYQQPDHTISMTPSVSFGVSQTLEAMEIVDVNLDGLEDIVAGRTDGDVQVFVQNPDHTIDQTPDIYSTFYQTHIQTHGMSVADVNFDGGPDVVLANYNYGLVVLRNAFYPDCNANGDPDVRDIAGGISPDVNANGVPDDCECPGDLDGDFAVGLSDLSELLTNFGVTSGAGYTDGDIDLDGDVDLADLSSLLENFGTTCT